MTGEVTAARDTLPGRPVLLDAGSTETCDRCGARALWLVVFAAGPLAFCGHHYREWRAWRAGREPR